MEQTIHGVDRIASLVDEKKLTKADLELDEPLQSELPKKIMKTKGELDIATKE